MDPQIIKILDHIRSRIKELRHAKEQALVAGSPKNIEEYRRLVGEISGLQVAIVEVEDVMSRLDDEFDQ